MTKRDSNLESQYQSRLIGVLRDMFPGCFILKNDPEYLQGVPDLLILYGDRWAMLEVKAYEGAPEQPNQRYYVEQILGPMSFAEIIFPENERQVLDALQQSFKARRQTRVSKRKQERLD